MKILVDELPSDYHMDDCMFRLINGGCSLSQELCPRYKTEVSECDFLMSIEDYQISQEERKRKEAEMDELRQEIINACVLGGLKNDQN